jgi:streptomycin 6-kinase
MGGLVIPERLASTAVAWEGAPARAWLERLPVLVAEVSEAWDLDVAPPFEPGGNISWVAPARRRGDRAELVLKVQLPHPESDPEARALAAWGGKGAVRLEAHDPERRALLLERCDPGSPLGDEVDRRRALDAGLAIARALHDAPAPDGLPTLTEVLSAWAGSVEPRRALAPEVDDETWDLVLHTMRSRTPGSSEVLLHGDLNPTNVLRSQRGWLAIDPKPMIGDPAYDGARLVLQMPPDEGPDPVASLGERIDRAAVALRCRPDRLATWCAVAIIAGGTFAITTGDEPEGRRQLALLPLVRPHLG